MSEPLATPSLMQLATRYTLLPWRRQTMAGVIASLEVERARDGYGWVITSTGSLLARGGEWLASNTPERIAASRDDAEFSTLWDTAAEALGVALAHMKAHPTGYLSSVPGNLFTRHGSLGQTPTREDCTSLHAVLDVDATVVGGDGGFVVFMAAPQWPDMFHFAGLPVAYHCGIEHHAIFR